MRTRNMVFAALSLFFGLSCSGQANPNPVKPAIESQRPNYTITIVPPSGPLSLKSPLLIDVYYTNTTASDIYMNVFACSICTADRILLMKNGKEVETTPFQRLSTGRGSPSDFEKYRNRSRAGNGFTERYHPGVFWKGNRDLRKLYNITEPGQYTVIASRTEETKDGKVVVKSNTVTLNIVS
jgi:hypothetical protein